MLFTVFLQSFRCKRIQQKFEVKFNCQPQFYARAPGRVNLIGNFKGYKIKKQEIHEMHE